MLGSESFELYDCPLELVANSSQATSVTCNVYRPPTEINESAALATGDLPAQFDYALAPAYQGEAIAIRRGAWVWVLDPKRQRQDLLVADGIVDCKPEEYVTFRALRVDYIRAEWSVRGINGHYFVGNREQ
jgi:hypothetical protein